MPEEQVTPEQNTISQEPAQVSINPFASQSWAETIVDNTDKTNQPPPVDTPIDKNIEVKEEAEIVDPKDWVKKEFGWEDVELGKKELAELRELKNKIPEEKKFANDTSQKLYEAWLEGKEEEVFTILDSKRKLDRLTKSEVDKMTASEIIKLNIQQKNKELTGDEVDFLFNKRYSMPEKPQQSTDELDEDYAARVSQWQAQVQEKEKELIIEAKMAKPELEKLKSEIVLPNTKGDEAAKIAEAQQRELERLGQLRTLYKQTLENDFKKFNGYEIKYKDEEVEIPVNFGVTDEEKTALKAELENFDVDDFWTKRWFNQDGSPNIQQTMSDIILLRQKDNVLQKVVNEVGTKMREHYIKLRTNTHVNGGQNTSFQPQKQNGQQVNPFAANSWKENPTVQLS